MTRCCALLCENTGIKKFPEDKKLRQQWESAVRIKGFKAKDSDRLCGIHYAYLSINLEQAGQPSGNNSAPSKVAKSREAKSAVKAEETRPKPVFQTKSLIKPVFQKTPTSTKLVPPSLKRLEVKSTNLTKQQVPITTIYLAEHDDAALQACRACLLSNCRLYPTDQLSLKEMFRQLTGLQMDGVGNLPTSLCAECAIFLRKCQRFRLKSRKAQALLNLMAKEQRPVTLLKIQQINRESNKLCSNLSVKHIPPDHYDIGLYDEKFEDLKIEVDSDQVKIEISDTEEDTKIEFKSDIEDNADYLEAANEFDINYDQTDDNQITKIETKNKEENDEKEIKNKTNDQTDFQIIKQSATVKLKEEDDSGEFISELKHEKAKKNKIYKNKQSDSTKVNKRKLRPQKKDDEGPRKKRTRSNLLLTNDYVIEGFEVKRLSLEEQREAFEKRKETRNYKRRAFKCDVCHKATNIKRRLESHMLNHSENYSKLVCNICQTRFKWRSKLLAHKRLHEYVYSCSKCSFTTPESKYATKHLEIHEGKRYPCEKCRKQFKTNEGYLAHLRLRHPTFQHVCCLCGLAFLTKREMKAHHTQKHLFDSTEIPPEGPTCAECSLRLLNEEALQTHLRNSHGTNENIDDATPPLLIANNTKRKRNRPTKTQPTKSKSYNKQKEVVCELCGKLVKENSIDLHLDEHYGKPFPCPFCDKKFKNKSRWYQHKYLQHNTLKYRLDCEKCGRKMSSYGNLKRHIERVHSDLPAKFICEFCQRAFRIKDDMKAHIVHMHFNKPWPKRGKNREQKDELMA